MSIARSVVGCLLTGLLVGCGGSGVKGRYVGQGETFFDSLTFGAENKVEIVFVGGKHQGSYSLDDERVTITAPNGDQSILTVDGNGCLRNQLLGTYCRDASATTSSSSSAPAGGQLTEVYVADAREGRIELEFGAAKKVRLTMTPSAGSNVPERMSFDVAYEVNGNQLAINLPGNERLMLTRTGDSLEGTMQGETVRFVKR